MSSVCDGCGKGGPLIKHSLGRDFFGGVYDRLTPASDRAPAWYCQDCSRQKHMQRDYRSISEALDRLMADEASPLSDAGEAARAAARLAEIAKGVGSGLLEKAEVEALRARLKECGLA
ncbi:MAG: hypothetical protein ACE5FN_08090 [Leptospirillia bacterium]